jgi:hypothetical protein
MEGPGPKPNDRHTQGDERAQEAPRERIREASAQWSGHERRRGRGGPSADSPLRQPRRGALNTLRDSPIRNGLIGLAVAGTAAPIVVSRHQAALRTNPQNENVLTSETAMGGASEEGLSEMWQGLTTAEASAAQERDAAITESLDRYAAYNLSRELAEEIYDVAASENIEPEIAYGLIRAESAFKNSATSPVGAVGLTQLMPRTAAWMEPGVTRAQLRDSGTNLRIGFKYLRSLIDKYEGDTKLALIAYNRGPGTVDRELRNGRDPDNGYADFVFGRKDHGHKLFTSR